MDIYATLMHSTGRFTAFGPSHLATLGFAVALGLLLVRVARSKGTERTSSAIRIALGVTILSLETIFVLYPIPLGTFHARYSLPLQLCDITAYCAAMALLTRWQAFTEIAFYLGTTATMVTCISPDLALDFPHIEFICFFASHALVTVSMTFMVFGLRQWPRRTAPFRVFAFVNVYGLLMAIVNCLIGSNYLYIRCKPGVTTIMDWMGPWPYYIGCMDMLLVLCLLTVDRIVRASQGSATALVTSQ